MSSAALKRSPESSGAKETRGATWQLAEFVSNSRSHAIPDLLRSVLHDATIDAIGCGLFGLTTEACGIIQDYALEQAGPAEATPWLAGGVRISAANAALSMGTAIHGFDFDDHHRAKIHPGAAVLPAALTMSERQGTDGKLFLAALAAGYETMARVSLAANPNSSRMRGWHLTGTTGTFGAAAAASVILGLDASQTASALGIAGTQSSGLWAFNADGAMSKRLHPGLAAQSGVRAALLAQRGFHGPRHILEAKDGGFLAATSDDVRLEEIGKDLGRVWRAEGVCFKPYSCCGSNHASIDAALELAATHRIKPQDIERIVIGISRVVERQTGFPYEPTTVLNAQMSIRYNVAVALIDGNALVEQFTPERISDPAVLDLVSRIDVEVDPEMDAVYPARYAGIVTISTRDGRNERKRVDYSKGMPENRMSSEELRTKFISLASAAIGQTEANALLSALVPIFEQDSLTPLARQLGSARLVGTRSEA